MPKLTVNGIEVEMPAGATVLQACEAAGAEIPRFCYHERLSIAGNCRMCLVEQEKAPKPIASCAMPAVDGMVIHTDTPMVKKARRGVMEFLLINHPLDCPICDQGGECDLQDQAMAYGYDRSRFAENKRAVKDKNLGPLIKTFMNRCIHCTRCIRFASEVAGAPELGATGRGEDMEVGTYVEAAVTSELSGNLVDLCPVGALTSKPYAFAARPWELRKTETIDVLDGVGSAIRVDSRGNQVLRILPRPNDLINEEWISDKTRHAVDGLSHGRLDRPLMKEDGLYFEISWSEAFAVLKKKFFETPAEKIANLVGTQTDCETLFAMKQLLDGLGINNRDSRPYGSQIASDLNEKANPTAYRFNSTFAGIDSADAILLIGTNPRWEAAVINARIRKAYLSGKTKIGVIGPAIDLTYPYSHIGTNPTALLALYQGNGNSAQKIFASHLAKAERPMVIVGDAVFCRNDAAAIIETLDQFITHFGLVRDGWNGFNVLHRHAGIVGALELGFTPTKGGMDSAAMASPTAQDLGLVWLLGVDWLHDRPVNADDFGEAFVVYQGHHGDHGARRADLVLPAAAYTEKSGTYVNSEGRIQRGEQAIFPLGEAREDWKIIRAAADHLGVTLAFSTLEELRQEMVKYHPQFAQINQVPAANWQGISLKHDANPAATQLGLDDFVLPITDFYQTCAISRASKTMQACSKQFIHGETVNDPTEAEAVYG